MEFKGLDNSRDDGGVRYLIVFIVIGVLLVTFWAREGGVGPLNTVRSAVSVVTTPIAKVGSALGVPFTAIGNAMTNISSDTDSMTAMQQRNAELTNEVTQLEEYKQENARLTALLDMEDTYNVSGTAARVISQSSDSYSRTVTIDKGSSDGLKVGMPVMSSQGLIGQIDSVEPTSAVVMLITDVDSGVAAMVQANRVEGVVTGSVNGLLYLQYVSVDDEVSVGDAIITSGLGGSYPKGILIGEVVSVQDGTGDLYHTIIVTPTAGSENFEEVLVVTQTDVATTQ